MRSPAGCSGSTKTDCTAIRTSRTATTTERHQGWDPALYQSAHAFVWEFGRDLLTLLAPQPGERILDLGCGTGQLTSELAKSGARVVGVDRSPAMIAQARQNGPSLDFVVSDAAALPFRGAFDAVFSNAALHWVRDAEGAVASIRAALRPGGRLVAEMGGRGNNARVLNAICAALEAEGVAEPRRLTPWYFPSVGEYASLLERHGLTVTLAVLFERPTRLEHGRDGLAGWIRMFGASFLDAVPPARRDAFLHSVEEAAAPDLLHDGVWTADYVRLRIVARA